MSSKKISSERMTYQSQAQIPEVEQPGVELPEMEDTVGEARNQQSGHPRHERGADDEGANEIVPKRMKLDLDLNKTVCGIVRLFLEKNLSMSVADDIPKRLHVVKQEYDAYNKTLNRHTMADYINIAADQIYGLIAEDVRGCFPSIMFASASRDGRHVFAASLRYLKNTKIVERTIGMLTQTERHTDTILKRQLVDLLSSIRLTKDKIYATCTDQGRNMLKAADLLIQAQGALRICRALERESEQHEGQRSEDDESEGAEEDLADILEEGKADRLRAELMIEDNLREVERDVADEVLEGPLASKMVCGPHNLQLAANDITRQYAEEIAELCAVVIASKKRQYRHVLAQYNIQRLRSDTKPRWGRTWEMAYDCQKNRDKLEQINEQELRLSANTWDFIEEFVRVFAPVQAAMKDFQKTKLTMSEFFIRWVKMRSQIRTLANSVMRNQLIERLDFRVEKFFECDAFIAALLLDPRIPWGQGRFNNLLQERGTVQIEKIHQALQGEARVQVEAAAEAVEEDEVVAEMRDYLGSLPVSQQDPRIPRILSIRQQVAKWLIEKPAIDINCPNFNVLEYWHEKRNISEWESLYKASQVVYGAAFSQVKAERDFSGFALVMTHLRSRLSEKTLNSIIVVKYNIDLLEKVKFF